MAILKADNSHPSETVDAEMSRCLFGDWPRRTLLKLTQPVNDWPLSLQVRRDNLNSDKKL
ncbi:MAG: hypothetical protein KC592_05140 [Nitrospira sp.]|nr:hypothetical protein [Nitrospira sp.]HBP86590.1 hypothetical protein [Nitrospiraceae bacterium]HNP27744.1 hypothetical protein [Nitrospirales bacterium]